MQYFVLIMISVVLAIFFFFFFRILLSIFGYDFEIYKIDKDDDF